MAKGSAVPSRKAPGHVRQPIYKSRTSLHSPFLADGESTCIASRPQIIVIRGLGAEVRSPLDFYIPIIRTYPINSPPRQSPDPDCRSRNPIIQHLDITTTWHLERYEAAQKLYQIHQCFTITLQRILADELWRIYQKHDDVIEFHKE